MYTKILKEIKLSCNSIIVQEIAGAPDSQHLMANELSGAPDPHSKCKTKIEVKIKLK